MMVLNAGRPVWEGSIGPTGAGRQWGEGEYLVRFRSSEKDSWPVARGEWFRTDRVIITEDDARAFVAAAYPLMDVKERIGYEPDQADLYVWLWGVLTPLFHWDHINCLP